MPTKNQTSNLPAELTKLLERRKELDQILVQRRKELDERIKIVKQGDVKRRVLLAFVKKHGAGRSDLLWVYQQLPPTRITRVHRLKQHATKAKHKAGKDYPPKPELIPLGKRINELREAKGINRTSLAKAVGVHGSMITGWERGLWRIKPDVMAKLEKVLGPLPKVKNPNANGEK